MADANFQNYSTVQNNLQPFPQTIAAAATIAPASFITFLTGTTQVVTITPPVSGQHMLVLVFTNAAPGAFTTGGNIQRAGQPVQNVPVCLYYDPLTAKYWVGPVSAVV